MANNLYQAILDRIRRIPGRIIPGIRRVPIGAPPTAQPVIPFAPGRIYKTVYRNYKHDPRPLVFVLSSDAFYTHGINIHYLGGYQGLMLRMIMDFRNSGQIVTGLIMYRFMKQRYPMIPKAGYRLYFTRYLAGRLVSDGISQMPLPNRALFITEPFVHALNRMIRPRVINRVNMTQEEADRLANQMTEATHEADRISIERRSTGQ
jgi:hypothetical protein